MPSVMRIPRAIGFTSGVEKPRMAGLQSGEGRMMIDSVVLAQYINVTDTHTDRHVTVATAALTHCYRRHNINNKVALTSPVCFC